MCILCSAFRQPRVTSNREQRVITIVNVFAVLHLLGVLDTELIVWHVWTLCYVRCAVSKWLLIYLVIVA